MKQILLGLVVVIALFVLTFGGSLPRSMDELRNGSLKFEFKPLINIGGMFQRRSESINRSIKMP